MKTPLKTRLLHSGTVYEGETLIELCKAAHDRIEYLEAAERDAKGAEAYAVELEAGLIAAMQHVAEYSNDGHLVSWARDVLTKMGGQPNA
jgi:hypothetical protein